MRAGHVYVLKNKELCKVGYSIEPKSRIRALINEYNIKDAVYWISKVCGDARQWESAVHERLMDVRDSGEWFSIGLDGCVSAVEKLIPSDDYVRSITDYEKSFYIQPYELAKALEIFYTRDTGNPRDYEIDLIIKDAINLLHKKEVK